MVFFIKCADKYLGNMVCGFLGLFNKEKAIDNKKIDKILVLQFWGIGETILILPALEALRQKFPNAKIDVLATIRNKDVFFENKNIDNLRLIDINPYSALRFIFKNVKKYHLVIDMEEYLNISSIIAFFVGKNSVGYSHGPRSRLYNKRVGYNDKQHAAQSFLDLIRALGAEYETKSLLSLRYSDNDKKAVDKLLKNSGIKKEEKFVCVAPGAAESAKCRIWPIGRYAVLCEEIIYNHKTKIIFSGAQNEIELIGLIQNKMKNKENTINAAGHLSLNQVFYLISRCKLFIGNDSGPMHIAAAMGTKTLGLFGPNLPKRFGPYGKGNIGLYKGYNCEFSPCINVHKGQVPDCLYPKESNDYQKCMKNIGVEDVLKEVEKLI
jgi:heptosyltransferase II